MIADSRPLRFLTVVLGGWVGTRALLLWPVAEVVPDLVHAVAPPAEAAAAPAELALSPSPIPASTGVRPRREPGPPTLGTIAPSEPGVAVGRANASILAPAPRDTPLDPPVPATWFVAGTDPPPTFTASRWSGSAWAIVRPEGRATPFASQLGGSQAGARIAYALGAARRVAVYARASAAIDAAEREAAVGVDWRPTRLPLHLLVERRIGIEGVRSGTAIGAVGGVGPTRLAGTVRIEGYAQGGVIVRDRAEGFADGSLRLTAPVTTRVDLGLGSWGGAQRGAARLDVGPTIGVTMPVARHALRLSADWRERVAGSARPGSGPAVSLGVDF